MICREFALERKMIDLSHTCVVPFNNLCVTKWVMLNQILLSWNILTQPNASAPQWLSFRRFSWIFNITLLTTKNDLNVGLMKIYIKKLREAHIYLINKTAYQVNYQEVNSDNVNRTLGCVSIHKNSLKTSISLPVITCI